MRALETDHLVVKQAPSRPEAVEAALRLGQCFKEEGQAKVDAARKKLATANLKPEYRAAIADLEKQGGKVEVLGEESDEPREQSA